jgi:putative phosphoribosyl transferase
MTKQNSAYRDRLEAGRILAGLVRHEIHTTNVIVLALPRGGVPIGFQVAHTLRAPLDVLVVRKLGVPGQPELAMGAIASGGFRILNHALISQLEITEPHIADIIARETDELTRREALYRGHRPLWDVHGVTVVLVDDGLATGSTMRAAIGTLRKHSPERVVVAVPVGAEDTCVEIAKEADALICPLQPPVFFSVSEWYRDFTQTTDDQVREYLAAAAHDIKAA